VTIRHSIPNKEVDLMLMADAPSLKDWRDTENHPCAIPEDR